jgi:hypothetical protein
MTLHLGTKDRKRFWTKVSMGPVSECWPWRRSTNNHGYGKFFIKGRLFGAHRIAYLLERGPLGRLFCLHRCDNSLCCNPDHLFPGTVLDNNRDCIAKGHKASTAGELHSSRKLDSRDVSELRRLSTTMTYLQLANKFGISRGHSRAIVLGLYWKGVAADKAGIEVKR